MTLLSIENDVLRAGIKSCCESEDISAGCETLVTLRSGNPLKITAENRVENSKIMKLKNKNQIVFKSLFSH